eukprot:RCo043128
MEGSGLVPGAVPAPTPAAASVPTAPDPSLLTLAALQRLQLTRRAIEGWLHDAELEEIVKGCYVRVLVDKDKNGRSIAKTYRVSEVIGITKDAEYKLRDLGKTNLHLTLQYGDQISTCKIDHVSNSGFLPVEFETWRSMMNFCHVPLITPEDVLYKLRKVKTYVQLCEQD